MIRAQVHNALKVIGMAGAGAVGVLLMHGCATTSGGAFDPSLSQSEYAQISDEQCAGVPEKERELGLLAYKEAIASTQPLKEDEAVGKVKFTRQRGVQIAVRAQPSMSAPWLERVAACHVALARAGRISPSGDDPLLVAGATVGVAEAYTGFVVQVHVKDDAAATEVMRRATAVLETHSSTATAERLDH